MTEQKRLIQHGFNSIEIEKDKLLKIIIENKEKHVEEYNKSVKAYEVAKLTYAQEYWAQLSENIGLAKKIMDEKLELVADAVLMARDIHQTGDDVIDLTHINSSVSYSLAPKVTLSVKSPVSHEKEYSVAIRGLELSTAEFVFLDAGDFSRYVLDEWDWKTSFAANNSVLFSGASVSNNSYFSNNGGGVMLSGCFVEQSGGYGNGLTIASGTNILTSASGASISFGEKSSKLFSSIYNNLGDK